MKLRIRNWDRFQHYGDRAPPWIKLHNSIIEDYEFECLADAHKAHLLCLFLLASRTGNSIEPDARWISRRIAANEPVDLAALSPWLEWEDGSKYAAEHDASTALAYRSGNGTVTVPSVEKRREEKNREEERRGGQAPPPHTRTDWQAVYRELTGETLRGAMHGGELATLAKEHGDEVVREEIRAERDRVPSQPLKFHNIRKRIEDRARGEAWVGSPAHRFKRAEPAEHHPPALEAPALPLLTGEPWSGFLESIRPRVSEPAFARYFIPAQAYEDNGEIVIHYEDPKLRQFCRENYRDIIADYMNGQGFSVRWHGEEA